jgi:RNA ligase (TIGR02306 family)
MSTEHDVLVARLRDVRKHPDADSLSITEIDGRPVIFRNGEYAPGDLAVYLPVDTLAPVADPRFAFLAPRGVDANGFHRVRAMRLRGVFSMGLLVKPEAGWVEGESVADRLGTRVWEPIVDVSATDEEPDPGFVPTYTDIESLRKWRHVFRDDEEVVATEKIHGANARYLWRDRLWCGSKSTLKRQSPASMWCIVA